MCGEDMEWWIQTIISMVMTVTVGIIGFFVKRALTQNDQRQAQFKQEMCERLDKTEDRADKLESRLNKLLQELPMLYTLREDWLRSNANIDQKLDRITDLIVERMGNP